MTKKRRAAAPARLRSSLKARSTRRPPRRRAFSEGDVRSKLSKREATGHRPTPSGGCSAETVAHFQALQTAAASTALADVYEWLGDAVIGELVGRCLLSQFHRAPLSARVFRNLRLAVVTNRNLAQVHDAMGYGGVRRRSVSALASDGTPAAWKPLKMKERADVVEAVVGELVLRLHAQKQRPELEDGNAYRTHLDAVVAAMLQTHFAERTREAAERGETMMAAKGPLSVAFNPFSCLPDEQLDESTGELVVHDGVFEHEAFTEQEEEEDELDRSFSDLIEEYKDVQPTTASTAQHHYFPPVGVTSTHCKMHEDAVLVQLAQRAILEVDEAHVLRTSSEIFEVFKIYGMAVLSERMSLALALPHVSLSSQHQGSFTVTPARLTRQRQLVLSVANLASCAIALGIAEPSASEEGKNGASVEDGESAARRLQEERGRANTLRAFAGFHSAVASTSSTAATQRSNILVSAICAALHGAVLPHMKEEENTITPSSNSGTPVLLGIPEREPLVDLMRAVGETRVFMNSKTCDELHAKGERPVPAATSKAKHEPQVSLLLRQCDSDQVEDLFDTLEKEQSRQRQLSEARAASKQQQKRQARKKKSHLSTDGTGPAGVRIPGSLDRFLHRRFLFCLEEIVVLFAQRKTEECRGQIAKFEHDLEPCADASSFRKWEVSTSTLTLVMRDSFYRLLLHDVCQFHAVVSSSRSTRDGTRITQLRLPLHYTWAKVGTRITTEQQARC